MASEEKGDEQPPSGNASVQSSVTSQVQEDLDENNSINGENYMGDKEDNPECPLEDSLDEGASDDLDEGASDDREDENIEEQDLSSEDSNIEVVV